MSISDYIEDISIPDSTTIPDLKSEVDDAKTFLQRVSPFTGDNMYDHLSDLLNKVLAERPENVIDFFEEYSRKVKEQRYLPLTDHLKDIYISPMQYEHTMKIMPYLKVKATPDEEPSTADPEDEEIIDPSRRDLIQFLYYYEKAGLGLPKTELYLIELSIKQLIKISKFSDIRFWGKIYGLYKNYLILEAELSEEEIARRNTPPEEDLRPLDPLPNEIDEALADLEKRQEQYGEGEPPQQTKYPRPLPPMPVSDWQTMPETPVEMLGVGVNKKTYYVCNEIGDPWIELPDVTPQQLVAARQIVKGFSGNLDTEVISYPLFPGTERNYLRAQIARISAGTQISPLGYYSFKGGDGEGDEEEEEEEEEDETKGGMKTSYTVNKRYEPHPMTDLTDTTMSFWVHHTMHILPQGRTQWWNPYPKEELGEEEMGEEEQDEEPKGPHMEPETGPPLLTPLSEDASLEATSPWSVRVTSALFPEHAIALVRSNLWPGAYTFTSARIFENIYVGNGQKHFAHNFSPTPLPYIQEEYPLGPEIMEMMDPTAEEEEAWRIAHEKIAVELKVGEEEGEEEEEEEEEDDD